MTATQPKLPKVFKRKWVEALRSGKFEQGKRCLKTPEGRYCCLGVAGKISGVSEKELRNSDVLEARHVSEPIFKALNFTRSDAPMQSFLAEKNDNGWSFKRIASYIERYL